jgi:hypothetical protein
LKKRYTARPPPTQAGGEVYRMAKVELTDALIVFLYGIDASRQ